LAAPSGRAEGWWFGKIGRSCGAVGRVTGVWVLLVAVVVAVVIGVVARRRDGRFRPRGPRGARSATTSPTAGSVLRSVAASRSVSVAQTGARQRSEVEGALVSESVGSGSGSWPGPETEDRTTTEADAGGPGADGVEDGLCGVLAGLGLALGERATLLQFSTAFCAPCRTARRVLAGVAQTVPGVRHVEVDAEAHLDLVRRLGIRRTPTVLVLDARGREARRASGAPPSRDAVFATLAEILPSAEGKGADGDFPEPSAVD